MKVFRLSGTVVGTEEATFMEALGMDFISATKIHNYLEEAGGEDVIFNLNSGGGSVFAGSEIYTMLKSYKGRVVVNITGLSASIASIFMCGADEINIAHHAQIMVHRPSLGIEGSIDEQELDKLKNMLNSTEKSLVSVYKERTSLSEDKLLDMMFKETWLTADEAVKLGFADNIITETTSEAVVAEELVAMVDRVNNEMGLLEVLKGLKGKQMKNSFMENIRKLLNEATEEVSVEEVAEEVVEEETKEEVVEEATEQPVVEETAEVNEEEIEMTSLMQKAINEITSLRETVERLEQENATILAENNQLKTKNSKSNSVISELNKLVSKEETNILVVSQSKEHKSKNVMPKGYNGIHGGAK